MEPECRTGFGGRTSSSGASSASLGTSLAAMQRAALLPEQRGGRGGRGGAQAGSASMREGTSQVTLGTSARA